ncbi:hypothetical protein Bca52824_026578 [Brassica carinata]|uniref:Uncharacterized protein n=1 Tax=Brassica carinata TaxID=52824 RepID=A0A8X7SHY7_BRACI|nr:hypothetical protein Bca52824_026578 [Brassica carinata]
MPIVEELPKAGRKGLAFNKKWAERYAFMSLHGFTYQWNIIAGTHPAPSEGESTVLRARQLPLDPRQVDFLVGNMSGSAADDSFAAYQEVAKVMSAKRESASRTVSGDDVVVTGSCRATVLSAEDVTPVHKEHETLNRKALEEKDRRTARELDILDLKEKVKALEKIAQILLLMHWLPIMRIRT